MRIRPLILLMSVLMFGMAQVPVPVPLQNGGTGTGAPTAAGQMPTSTSTTSATWQALSTTFQPNAVSRVFSPLSYGAVCNGSAHSVTSTLGLSTMAAVAAYSVNGTTPYSWVTNSTWNHMTVPLTLMNAAVTGQTTFQFNEGFIKVPVGATVTGTQVVTGTVPTVTAVTNPGTATVVTSGTTSTIGTKNIVLTSGATIPVGSHPTPQTGLSVDDYVTVSSGTGITLKYGITAASIASGTTLTFQPPSTITISGTGLTANKPSLQSAASTATVNYYMYFTWSMTDAMIAAAEMDWLGTQSAIEAATAANGTTGGTVEMPAGNCIMGNATVANNTTGGLMVHESTGSGGDTGNSPNGTVDLIGHGQINTLLTWPSEMGAGRVALSFGVPWGTVDNLLGRVNQNNSYWGNLSGITLVGPMGFTGGSAVGTIGSQTIGLLAGGRRMVQRVNAFGFYIGATFDNIDHTEWQDVWLGKNVIGWEWGANGLGHYSNNQVFHLEVTQNTMANISLAKNSAWGQTDVKLLFCANSPKCIRQEPGFADNGAFVAGAGGIQSSRLDSINAESMGLGFIYDDNYGPNQVVGATLAGNEIVVEQVEMTNVYLSQAPAYAPAGNVFNYWIWLGNSGGNRIDFAGNGVVPPAVSGMKAVVFIDTTSYGEGGDMFYGPMRAILNNLGATPFFAFYSIPFNQTQTNVRVCEQNSWCGHAEYYGSATSAGQGVPLEYTTGVGGTDLSVQKAAGSAPFAGINMTTAPTNGGTTIVATKLCSINTNTPVITIPTSGTATALHWAKLAAGGTVTNATGPATAGEVVIGTIMEVTGSAARVNVGPNGSCD